MKPWIYTTCAVCTWCQIFQIEKFRELKWQRFNFGKTLKVFFQIFPSWVQNLCRLEFTLNQQYIICSPPWRTCCPISWAGTELAHGTSPCTWGTARGGWSTCCSDFVLVLFSAPSVPQPVFTIREKAPTRAFSWLKAPSSAFTFKTLLRHYAKWALTPR